jgi:hypothetical protein
MQSREVPFSEFVKNVTGGEIRAVTLDGEKVRFTGPIIENSLLFVPVMLMLRIY